MKAIEQHFQVILFIMLYKVARSLKSEDETLVCGPGRLNWKKNFVFFSSLELFLCGSERDT